MRNTFHSEPTEHDNPYHHNPYKQTAPPPPKKSHWAYIVLVTSLVWLLVDVIAGSIAMPYVIPSRVVKVTATPEIVKVYIPVSGIPPYQTGLHAQGDSIFVKSFSEALSYNDATSIATITDTTKFREVCHEADPLNAMWGKCNNDWNTFKSQLMNDDIEISIDPYTIMTNKPPYPDVSTITTDSNTPIVYLTQQNGLVNRSFTLQVSHYPTVVFSIMICCGGSGSSHVLESVDIY